MCVTLMDCAGGCDVEGMSDLEACMLAGDHNEHVAAREYYLWLMDEVDPCEAQRMRDEAEAQAFYDQCARELTVSMKYAPVDYSDMNDRIPF